MFGKNLRYLREKANMEQMDLANTLGRKSASSISEWEKGKYTPKLKTLNDIANIFNVTIDELMESNLTSPAVEQVDTKQIPVVSKISAGIPIYAEENIIDYAYIPSYLSKHGKELFYLQVDGDSMDKEFRSGDLVLVDKTATVENGQIAVVMVNGYNATVKRVRYQDDTIMLLPESNNTAHLPQIYTKNDDVKIVGRVISVQKYY